MRKKRTAELQEQTLERPVKRGQIHEQAVVVAMRRLMINEDFKILRGLWLTKRYEKLESGKSKPETAKWDELRGFDDAVMECGKWANKETPDDKHSKRAAELQARLAGEK